MATQDDDWLNPPTLPSPPSTPPPAPFRGVWRCDDVGAEPRQHSSLIEATSEPPRSTDAEVYGGGAMLAQASEDVMVWSYTREGMRRLDREARGVLEKDHDVVLSVVLASDLDVAS